MDKRFQGKVAFITGGASGIGKATAEAFAAEGANLAIVTVSSLKKAQDAAGEIAAKYGVKAIGLQCDVRIEDQVEAAVSETVEKLGAIDYAFNNAGVGADGVTIMNLPLHEVPEKDWDWVMDVDCKGVFLCMKHEIRQMRKQGSGAIVNTASTAGLKAMADFGAYGPAKAGLIMLTKSAAVENRDAGIRCNVVCPGPTLGTGMADRAFGKNGEKTGAGGGGVPPIFGRPADVADVVLTLCSDACRKVTGNVVTADGGLDVI
jgi:NAD(P)-dependent dehydrogenase (short-subunit alcohol dehydrogenase family)